MTGPSDIPGRRKDAKRELPPYVNVTTAKGKSYFYFHPNRDPNIKPVRIKHELSDQRFWDEYDRLVEAAGLQNLTIKSATVDPGTVGALVGEYSKSKDHERKPHSTRKYYEYYLPVIKEHFRHVLVRDLTATTIAEKRDEYGERVGAANNYLRTFSMLLSWGMGKDFCDRNVALSIPKLKGGSIKPWPWAAVIFARKHMRPHMWAAVATAVYTGQRKSDCLAMKWSAVGNGKLEVLVDDSPSEDAEPGRMSEEKALAMLYEDTGLVPKGWDVTQLKTGKTLKIALHPEYAQVLEQLPRTAVTVLTTKHGRPWKSGFYASWRKEMARPELAPLLALGLTFHGLRKTAVGKLLEAGCTTAEARAVTGHSLQMLEYYAKGVDQEALAETAIRKWENFGT